MSSASKSRSRTTRVAIVGDGPAGSALATLLARKGVDVAVFASGKRPDLLVGESLIPAIVPIFRKLGIEEEVAEIAQVKKGGTFVWRDDSPIELSFENLGGLLPHYAYNCPRPALDEIISRCAQRSGARWIPQPAKVRLGNPEQGENELMLDEKTIRSVEAWRGSQPDLVVDSTGRRRLFVRLLNIPADEGPRKDIAHFAHFRGWHHDAPPGQIMISRMECGGWSWRIPLRDEMSVGIVVPKVAADRLGTTPEERLERAITLNSALAESGRDRERTTDVPTYNNYQLITQRGYGPGWTAAGDAFGFVDPMLSPGMWVALRSAEMLAEAIPTESISSECWAVLLSSYEKKMVTLLSSWQRLIASFYDGTIVASYFGGREFMLKRRNPLVNMMEKHVQRNLAGMAAGALTESAYSQGLLRFICRYGNYGVNAEELEIG